jgi:hypothetical protein
MTNQGNSNRTVDFLCFLFRLNYGAALNSVGRRSSSFFGSRNDVTSIQTLL